MALDDKTSTLKKFNDRLDASRKEHEKQGIEKQNQLVEKMRQEHEAEEQKREKEYEDVKKELAEKVKKDTD